MKTIAVLTDFSERSAHAARYALPLAQALGADILLFNAFLVPSAIPMAAAQLAWPVDEYEQLKAGAEQSLRKFSDQLKHDVKVRPQPGTYLPVISTLCAAGPLTTALSALEARPDIMLLVAGTHSSGALTTFVLGNNCRGLIDTSHLPLLLVPEHAVFKPLDKLVFATDLDRGDVHYINAVTSLAAAFSANVLVANIVPEKSAGSKHNQAENILMRELVQQIRYRRISFRDIPAGKVKKALVNLLADEKPDLLVMVHRNNRPADFLFRSSMTQSLAEKTTVPLLVYPCPMPVIPAF